MLHVLPLIFDSERHFRQTRGQEKRGQINFTEEFKRNYLIFFHLLIFFPSSLCRPILPPAFINLTLTCTPLPLTSALILIDLLHVSLHVRPHSRAIKKEIPLRSRKFEHESILFPVHWTIGCSHSIRQSLKIFPLLLLLLTRTLLMAGTFLTSLHMSAHGDRESLDDIR